MSGTSPSQSYTSDQWIRKWSLIAYDADGKNIATQISGGSDIPGEETLRIIFNVKQSTGPVPNNCTVRIYNPSTNLVSLVKNQYRRITLAAGYMNGRFGTIFDGTIRQILFGAESAVDSYLEIDAADGDLVFTQATVNTTLSGNANTALGRMQAISKALTPWGVTVPSQSFVDVPNNPPNPRPTVMYGMGADFTSLQAKSIYADGQPMEWSIQNGQFVLVPSNNSIPDTTAFILNSLTGMVGFPSTTSDGIEVRTLLNPSFSIRRPVQINNAVINQTLAVGSLNANAPGVQGPVFPGPTANFIMDTSADGTYLIYVVEHHGDSRGNDWYSDLVLVAATATGKVTTAYSGIAAETNALKSSAGS